MELEEAILKELARGAASAKELRQWLGNRWKVWEIEENAYFLVAGGKVGKIENPDNGEDVFYLEK